MEKAGIKRVYVWEIPVRLYHWINFLAVFTLAVTGYLIGNPPAIQSATEASYGYWFGTIRFIHFVAAFVFLFNFIFRIYWGFAGNRYANWRSFIPHSKKNLKEIVDVFKLVMLQKKGKPLISIGHNSLAGVTYLLTFLIFLFQIITGLAMYAAASDSFFPRLFVWIIPLLGGEFSVRNWHHIMMWFFIIFAMIHVYLVFYHDYVEGRGILSSMAGGWKFIEKNK